MRVLVRVQYRTPAARPGGDIDALPRGRLEVADAPIPVRDALKDRGKVLRLETVQKNGAITYEARVQGKTGKKSSVILSADGKPVKR